jgi:cytochrome c-type biogenesis protein CcmE
MMVSKTPVCMRCRFRVPLAFFLVLFVPLLFVSRGNADLLEMADLMAHPEVYDHKTVVVIGLVRDVQLVMDQKGEPTFKFLLADDDGALKVTSRIQVQNGDQVIVEGTFTRRRQGGRLTVYNEVNAFTIRPLNQFNSDLIG